MTNEQVLNHFPKEIRDQYEIGISDDGYLNIRGVAVKVDVIYEIKHAANHYYHIATTKDIGVALWYRTNTIRVVQI